MTERNFPNGPWTVQGTTGLDAEAERELINSLMRIIGSGLHLSGVISVADLAVTASTTPDGNVHVAAGQCFIPGTQGTFQGVYHASNDASKPLAVAAASTTLPRHDIVCASIVDAQYSGGAQTVTPFVLQVITGTPNASPVDPALPANSIALARISLPAVPSGPTNVLSSWITDMRAVAGRRPRLRVHLAANQNVGAGVTTSIPPASGSTVDTDTENGWSNTSSLYTVAVAGWYKVFGKGYINTLPNTGDVGLHTMIGGSDAGPDDSKFMNNKETVYANDEVFLAAGTTVGWQIANSTAGQLTVSADNRYTFFGLVWQHP